MLQVRTPREAPREARHDAGPVSADGDTDAGTDGAGHRTSVVERGSFVSARCSCGWKGPARRARDRARRDAREHAAG